ncbi:hypothetical protein [Malikia spinosa]|uniref:Uncharacterized protein n=1 Tax=Malikia spinosa TaxID=86180 RepID=A0A7C9JM43_9BURK|nr:hypothetical protein [Malikia spinosa]MYZ52606.1 hypothetical protein [Malikia spinosa]
MIPIYEQGSVSNIGYGLSSFLLRFDEICIEHLSKGRAKSFAFIFYDFNDQDIRNILGDKGVFVQLDRLSGKELSVFYLHVGKKAAVESFNTTFLSALCIEGHAALPCVVFFRVRDGAIQDVEIAQLESANLIHGFSELHSVFQQYLSAKSSPSVESFRAALWLKGRANFLSVEIFRAALAKAMDFLL